MREFFKGWRRKLGCATLALALALTATWFWSLRKEYLAIVITSQHGATHVSFVGSNKFGFVWSHATIVGLPGFATDRKFHWTSSRDQWFQSSDMSFFWTLSKLIGKHPKSHDERQMWIDDFEDMKIRDWHCAGIRFAEFQMSRSQLSSTRITTWVLPQWAVIGTLCLVTIYLLLSKPRPAKPIATSDPDHA